MPTDCPTMVLAECFLIYLRNEDSENILRWINDFFGQAPYLSLCNYEMIEPFDSFGKTMITNLQDRGCDLLGIEGCPTLQSQIDRIQACWIGKELKVECEPMTTIYSKKLDATERSRIERLEIFDEFEEWNLIQAHYCIVVATIGGGEGGWPTWSSLEWLQNK